MATAWGLRRRRAAERTMGALGVPGLLSLTEAIPDASDSFTLYTDAAPFGWIGIRGRWGAGPSSLSVGQEPDETIDRDVTARHDYADAETLDIDELG